MSCPQRERAGGVAAPSGSSDYLINDCDELNRFAAGLQAAALAFLARRGRGRRCEADQLWRDLGFAECPPAAASSIRSMR